MNVPGSHVELLLGDVAVVVLPDEDVRFEPERQPGRVADRAEQRAPHVVVPLGGRRRDDVGPGVEGRVVPAELGEGVLDDGDGVGHVQDPLGHVVVDERRHGPTNRGRGK